MVHELYQEKSVRNKYNTYVHVKYLIVYNKE